MFTFVLKFQHICCLTILSILSINSVFEKNLLFGAYSPGVSGNSLTSQVQQESKRVAEVRPK